MKTAIGIDLGGTKLAVALIQADGQIVAFQKKSILELKRNSNSRTGPKKIIQLMTQIISELRASNSKYFREKNFCGVGLASAGPLNVEKGCLIDPINFSGWKTVPIKQMLKTELRQMGLPARVEFQNDAIAAALAEGWVGRAKKMKSYAVITLGTGVGTGVIFQGLPVQTHGMGSEFGHLVADNQKIRFPKQDLHDSTIEGFASGTGLLRRARKIGFRGDSLEELVQDLESSNGLEKQKYQDLFDGAADALAALCYNLSIGFNLEKILFSGGLIKIRHLFFNRMKLRYRALIGAMNPAFMAPLQIAQHSSDAGVIGAASLLLHKSPSS